MHQRKVREIFWKEILTKKPPVREILKYQSRDLSIDETPVIQPNEVYRVSQGGINTNLNLDILVLSDVNDYNYLDVPQLRNLIQACAKSSSTQPKVQPDGPVISDKLKSDQSKSDKTDKKSNVSSKSGPSEQPVPVQTNTQEQEREVGLRSAMLAFALFESDSGFEEIAERLSKFRRFHEITSIEDNFPFKLSDPVLFAKLINEAEVVFDPYS